MNVPLIILKRLPKIIIADETYYNKTIIFAKISGY